MRRVKSALAALTLLPLSLAKGELIADVVTDKGTIKVELQYAKTPKTVANFITMAQGTRARLDPATNEVIKKPLYVGEKFFRVVNGTTEDPNFKIIQTGSGTGNNNGVPGFTFKDEFDPTLTHVPYVLSMANAGVNTNGSQIFFTGNAAIASLNEMHTVFGLVKDVPSRAVIDAILAAGANATTITAVNFSRTDAPAQAFDELAQNLPTISVPDGTLRATTNVTWNFQSPIETGTIFRAYRATNLALNSWASLPAAEQQIGIGPVGNPPTLASVQLEATAATKGFYRLSNAFHPDCVTPNHLANRVVTVDLGNATLTYTFAASGSSGTVVYTPNIGSPIAGTFVTVDSGIGNTLTLPGSIGAHDITFVAQHTGLTPRELWFKIGCDSATTNLIHCHFSFQARSGIPFPWQSAGTSTLTITR